MSKRVRYEEKGDGKTLMPAPKRRKIEAKKSIFAAEVGIAHNVVFLAKTNKWNCQQCSDHVLAKMVCVIEREPHFTDEHANDAGNLVIEMFQKQDMDVGVYVSHWPDNFHFVLKKKIDYKPTRTIHLGYPMNFYELVDNAINKFQECFEKNRNAKSFKFTFDEMKTLTFQNLECLFKSDKWKTEFTKITDAPRSTRVFHVHSLDFAKPCADSVEIVLQ